MKHDPSTAYIHEIFSSIQGEGILLGSWQIFIRFRGCNLQCQLCDTKYVWQKSLEPLKVHSLAETGNSFLVRNPLTVRQLNELVDIMDAPSRFHAYLSITGGEPLEQAEFLHSWLPTIPGRLKIMLETNAILYEEVKSIRDFIHFAAMDYKLPSFTGGPDSSENHRKFYREMCAIPGCIKLVVTPKTQASELELAGKVIAESAPDKPVILQPLMEFRQQPVGSWVHALRRMAVVLQNYVSDVRVIPQMHRDWNIL